MSYYGSWKIDDTLTFVCNTHNPTNGSATDADAVPTYHVYEDETATPLITGSMSLLNGSNTHGFYSEQITLSAANGFEKGKSYNIYIQAVVVSVTGTMAHFFQLEAEVDANVVSDKAGYSLSSPQNFNLNGNITGTFVGNVNGAVTSVTNPVTVGTNNDKTGYSLSSPQNFNLIGNISGTHVGNLQGDVTGNVQGSVNSVVQPVGISTGTFLDALADKVWDEQLSGHLSAGSTGNALNAAGTAGDPWATSLPGSYVAGQAGHILASRMPTGTVIVSSNQDKTGYSLSSPQNFDLVGNVSGTMSNVLNVVNPVVSGMVTGSVLGNVNGSVNSVTTPVTVGTNNDKTGYSLSNSQAFDLIGNITGSISSVVNPVTVGTNNDKTGYGLATGTFLDAMADKVWDEAIAGHLIAGSTGEKLNAAGAAGDPWSTALPGSYVAGQAGHILASRMPTGTVIVSSNQDKTGYSLLSPQSINIIGNVSGTFVGNIQGNVTGSVGEVLTIAASLANKIADHVLRRTYANARQSSDGDAVSFRSLLGAIGKLVNRWSISGTTLTVYQEDDATATAPGGTQTLTGTAGADPITQIDTD